MLVPASKRKRTYNLRSIKLTWPYSVQEAAAHFSIHKNAVLRWLTEGLSANSDRRPYLIRGSELKRFLEERQRSKRQKCATTEFFCFKCRVPREPYGRIVDLLIESPTRLRMTAICTVCDTAMNKAQSVKSLAKIRSTFHVQQLHGEHIVECSDPSVNRDLEDNR